VNPHPAMIGRRYRNRGELDIDSTTFGLLFQDRREYAVGLMNEHLITLGQALESNIGEQTASQSIYEFCFRASRYLNRNGKFICSACQKAMFIQQCHNLAT
jgi:hypothetical protein